MSGRIFSLVVKVAERCNLSCSYCYMYQHADTSYRSRPKFMSDVVLDQLLLRVREYCDRHAPHQMALILHGGEPTLIGPERMGRMVGHSRDVLGDRLASIGMQTNATLLNPTWVDLIQRYQIRVGISLDGPPHVHDSARVDHAGRGSHRAAVRGLRLLQEAGLNPRVLCVVNPSMSGTDIYRYFRSVGITWMNFLLPDVSHDNKQRLYGRYGATPVADYLIPVFDAWFNEDNPEVRVTLFWEIIQRMLGGPIGKDVLGNPLMTYLVVESDGTIHALDALRVCEDGIAQSGLNVFDHGFDDLHLGLPLVYRAVHEGIPLCATCQRCPEESLCGGGYLPHRYARANGFDNPSVWCADILLLLAHIRARVEKGQDAQPAVRITEQKSAISS
jgi:uncharacterized protein